MSFRTLTCPDLVKEWRKIVNDNIELVRDAFLLKRFMAEHSATPPQILLGMHENKGSRTLTIPQMLRAWEEWLVEDEWEAELELAVRISHNEPAAYFIYHDFADEDETADNYARFIEAKQVLSVWKERILG